MNQSSENNSCVRSRLIAVTGGIGSGKSVVSRMLRCMGFAVYDCDSEARRLMDCSDEYLKIYCDYDLRDMEIIQEDSRMIEIMPMPNNNLFFFISISSLFNNIYILNCNKYTFISASTYGIGIDRINFIFSNSCENWFF